MAAWDVGDITTPIDSKAGVKAVKFGVALTSTGRVDAYLVARCFHKTTDVYVSVLDRRALAWNYHMAFAYHSFGGTTVRYKLGDGPIGTVTWSGSSDSDAVGSWNGAPVPWLKQLAKADQGKLTLEARGMQGRSSTYEFHVDGIREALAPIAKACGWSL